MRNLLVLLLLLVCGVASTVSLEEQEVKIRWACWRYRVNEPLLRAVLRLENGKRGSEAGLNPVRPTSVYGNHDVQSYSDPTAPDGSEQHCRLARRIVWAAQEFIFKDEYTRLQFARFFARTYHSNSSDQNNMDYARLLLKVWSEERKYVRARNALRGYSGMSGTPTEGP